MRFTPAAFDDKIPKKVLRIPCDANFRIDNRFHLFYIVHFFFVIVNDNTNSPCHSSSRSNSSSSAAFGTRHSRPTFSADSSPFAIIRRTCGNAHLKQLRHLFYR